MWLCTGTKCENIVLFGFGSGNNGKFRIFEEKKLKFSPFVTVKSAQEIGEIKRNNFFGVFLPVQIPYIPA